MNINDQLENEVKVGYENQLVELSGKIEVANNTFFFATPKLWNNSITAKQANAQSFDAFKRHFKKA